MRIIQLMRDSGRYVSKDLVKGPNFFLGKEAKAGVIGHAPPVTWQNADLPNNADVGEVVDGDISDLNRNNLSTVDPDERYKETTG